METEYKFTIDDVAETFNVTRETVRRWCREQKIGYIKLPGEKGEYRFSQKNVDEFVATLNIEPVQKFILDKKEKPVENT